MILRSSFLAIQAILATGFSGTLASDVENWNQFRGSQGNGVSAANKLPVEFDEARNIRWKIAIPDSGWSSPVVWNNEVWVTAGSDEKAELRALCIDLNSGQISKDIKVFDMVERKVDNAYGHDSPHLNSPATPTPVVEEEHVYVSFGSQGIACLDRKSGDKLWERRDMRIYQPVRQGSSPIVDDRALYVAFDGNDEQFFVALDKNTGETLWKVDRNVQSEWDAKLSGSSKPGDNNKSFATAQMIVVGGKQQLVAPAAEATIAYDPMSGEEIWRVFHPGGFNVAARPVFANGLVYVFTSGVARRLLAINPEGTGDVTASHVAWSSPRNSPGIPSPVIVDGLLFMVTEKGGIARCLNAKNGDELWKKRLGGDHWASPVLCDGKLYFCSKQGVVDVYPATQNEPESLARNQLNAQFIASPAVAGNALLLRSTTHLYCIAHGFQRTVEQVAADVYPTSKEIRANAQKAPNNFSNKTSGRALANLASQLREMVRAGKLSKADAMELYQAASGK